MSRRLIPTTTSPYWIEWREAEAERARNQLIAEQQEEEDRLNTFPIEPCRIPTECRADIVIAPGNQHAQAATKEGREDEYIDRMRGRYGGEW